LGVGHIGVDDLTLGWIVQAIERPNHDRMPRIKFTEADNARRILEETLASSAPVRSWDQDLAGISMNHVPAGWFIPAHTPISACIFQRAFCYQGEQAAEMIFGAEGQSERVSFRFRMEPIFRMRNYSFNQQLRRNYREAFHRC
jgi:hypothetical protein